MTNPMPKSTFRTTPAFKTRSASAWRTVAAREIDVKLRDKGFVISMLITLVIIIGAPLLSSLFDSGSDHNRVIVTDDRAAAVVSAAQHDLSSQGASDTVEAVRVANQAEARQRLQQDDDLVYLYRKGGQWRLDGYVDTPSDRESATRAMSSAVASTVVADSAKAAGIDPKSLTSRMSLKTGQIKADGKDHSVIAPVVGMVTGGLFMVLAVQFGYVIAGSVVEEEQSRIVEILLTALRARHLLFGKLVGNTVLAFGELIIICAGGLLALSFSSWSYFVTAALSWSVMWFLVFFLVGFVALASLFAAAGALASRTEDVQVTASPVMYLIMAVYAWVVFSMSNLDGISGRVGSYVPIASVVWMPLRMSIGNAAWWEPVLSILVTIGFTVGAVLVGERIYRRSILQTGGRVSLRKAWRQDESVA